MTQLAFAPTSGPQKYGISTSGPVTSTPSELHAIPTPGEGAAAAASLWNPANPLFWFAGIAAVTFGLMAVSTTVRVGKGTASVSLGSTGK